MLLLVSPRIHRGIEMKRRTILSLSALVILVASAIYVIKNKNALYADVVQNCVAHISPSSEQIELCTEALSFSGLTDELRADILFHRAYARQILAVPGAEEDYLASNKLMPNWLATLTNLGVLYNAEGRTDKALPYFEQAWVLDASSHKRRDLAKAYYNLERYDDALVAVDNTLALVGDDFWTVLLRARTLEKLNRYEDAIESYSRVIALDLQFQTNARRERAWVYSNDLERPYHAEVDLRYALNNQPLNSQNWVRYGDIMFRLNRYSNATNAYEQALSIDANSKHAQRGLVRVQNESARIRARTRRLITPEGRKIASSTFPVILGYNYLDLGETLLALNEFERVLKNSPNHPGALTGTAKAYSYDGRDEAEIKILKKLASLPVSAEGKEGLRYAHMQTRLGNVLHRSGDSEGAFDAWSLAVQSGHKELVSLWQILLEAEGHYSTWPDGNPTDALFQALSACATDENCAHPRI